MAALNMIVSLILLSVTLKAFTYVSRNTPIEYREKLSVNELRSDCADAISVAELERIKKYAKSLKEYRYEVIDLMLDGLMYQCLIKELENAK